MTEKSGIDPIYPYVDNKVKSLKRQITRLHNRIENLEILALQEQITKLDDDLTSINKSIINMARVVAISEMDSLQLHMHEAIDMRLPTDDSKRMRLSEYISVEHAKSKEKANNSTTPLAVFKAFRKDCVNCSDKNNLEAFKTKPY